MSHLSEKFLRLFHRYAWERSAGDGDLHAKRLKDFFAMFFPDGIEHMTKPGFFEIHHVVVGLDP